MLSPGSPGQTYLFQEAREWKSIVSSKGPDLSRCSGDFANDGRGEGKDDDCRHDIGTDFAVRDVVEELDEREAGVTVEECLSIGDGKAQSEDGDVTQDGVHSHSPQHGSWKRIRGIFDFFGYGQSA